MACLSEEEEDVIAERFGDKESVELVPFGHQVGGHFALMIFDPKHLAKPLIPRENFFYQTMGKALHPFLPKYKGVISMSFYKESSDAILCVAKKKIPEIITSHELSSHDRHVLRLNMKDFSSPRHNDHHKSDRDNEHTSPWALKCLHQLKDVLHNKEDKNGEYDYIVLENVVTNFDHPSILDLKLGTQSHSDVMPEAKQKLHMERCASTTSESLGVRFSGMQLFSNQTKEYIYKDKYYGRDLTPSGLEKEIKGFLCGGDVRNRRAVVESLLEKLAALKLLLEAQDSVRLFSVSLLLIYDGGSVSSSDVHRCCPMEVRMIDFANATHSGYVDDPYKYSGPDEGFLLGLNTVSRVATQVLSECTS